MQASPFFFRGVVLPSNTNFKLEKTFSGVTVLINQCFFNAISLSSVGEIDCKGENQVIV